MADDSELLAAVREQTAWIRALAISQVRETLVRLLDTDQKRNAFEASDGNRSTRDIAKLVDSSHMTVSRWWAQWRAAGVGVGVDAGDGHTRHLVSLKELGI